MVFFDSSITDRMWSRPQLQSLLLSHLGRAEKLELQIDNNKHLQPVFDALDVDMPHLRILDITFPIHELPDFDSDSGLFLPKAFTLSFPRPANLNHVRDLQILCLFDWSHVCLSNLTSLELIGDYNPAHDVTLSWILDVLESSPNIHTLDLRNLIRGNTHGQGNSPRGLSLPMLKHVTLHDTGIEFAKLLVCSADLPEMMGISLEFSIDNETTFTNLLVSAARRLNRHNPTKILLDPCALVDGVYSCDFDYEDGFKELRFRNICFRSGIDYIQATLLCLKETNLSNLYELHCTVRGHFSVGW